MTTNFLNIKNIRKNLVFLLIVTLFPLITSAQVVRENLGVEIVNDFVLEPAKNEVILVPGETSTETLSVINRMDKVVTFQIEIEDIVGSDNVSEQVKLLGNEKGPYSLKDFLIPEINEFTLNPGEKITIPIQVNLPADSEPRGYYGALIVSAKGDSSDVGNDSEVEGVTEIVTRLGSIFLVRVEGDLNQKSDLRDFKIVGPDKFLYTKNPEGFEVAIKNSGNVHLVHYGEIKVKNIFGKEVVNLPVNAFFSLPDATRYREIKWPETFVFGFYKAELNLYQGFGNESGFLKDTISFVVLPWKVLSIIIIATIMIYLIIRFFKNNFKIERKK